MSSEECGSEGPPLSPRLISLREALRRSGYRSRTTLYKLADRGEFPAPRRVSSHKIGFVDTEITEWILSRKPCHNGNSHE
jgi:predicted DNA-binding transcriptional regulator AlpA